MDNWYEYKIEEPIRKIVKALRNNGINTVCSCGHSMWIQCESYDPTEEFGIIYNVMDSLKIDNYRAILFHNVINGHRFKHIEIQFPDANREYYAVMKDNEDYIQNKIS